MKRDEVNVGGYYNARVSGHVVPIRIESVNTMGVGWNARNLVTNWRFWIKSAARLRMELTEAKALELAESLRTIRRDVQLNTSARALMENGEITAVEMGGCDEA